MMVSAMVNAIPDILAQIIEVKKTELGRIPRGLEYRAAASVASRRDFAGALRATCPAIIAEIKKASPSKGLLAPGFNPSRIAEAYGTGGAAALSVLTDEQHFEGSLQDLESARAATPLPVLRKDFTIDPAQIVESAAAGADAILLIAAILTGRQLRDFRETAETYNMAALVEVHDQEELSAAVDSGASVIGVNNRDLRTFEVSLEMSMRLAEHMPDRVTRVTESGIHSSADVRRLRAAGFHAFLVGEHLMRSGDPAQALRALLV
jgi:indole-3-glycerol phosphate synthase